MIQTTETNALLGIGLKVASTLVFSMLGACVKLLADRYPVGEIMFFRSAFALVPLALWLAWRGELATAPRTRNFFGHFRRSFVGALGMFLGFTALAFLPLPDATALGYSMPLIVVVLAALILKETVRIYRWSAVAVGFVGVLVMLSPYLSAARPGGGLSDDALAGAVAGLAAALCVAVAVIEVRRLSQTETIAAIVFYFSVLAAVLSLLTLWQGWRMPAGVDWAILIGCGFLGGAGQILLTASYRYADVSTVAPFEYTSMIWATALGYMLFSDIPDPMVAVGACVVIGAGLFVIWRERALGLKRAPAEKIGAPPK